MKEFMGKFKPNALLIGSGALWLAMATLAAASVVMDRQALPPEVWSFALGALLGVVSATAVGLVGLAKDVAQDPPPPVVPASIVEMLIRDYNAPICGGDCADAEDDEA